MVECNSELVRDVVLNLGSIVSNHLARSALSLATFWQNHPNNEQSPPDAIQNSREFRFRGSTTATARRFRGTVTSIAQTPAVEQTGGDHPILELEHSGVGTPEFLVGGGTVLSSISFDRSHTRDSCRQAG